MPQLEMAAEPALRRVKKLLKRVGQEPRLLDPDTEEALDGELQSSLTACRHQALAAVSPPRGAVEMPVCTYAHKPQNQCANSLACTDGELQLG